MKSVIEYVRNPIYWNTTEEEEERKKKEEEYNDKDWLKYQTISCFNQLTKEEQKEILNELLENHKIEE